MYKYLKQCKMNLYHMMYDAIKNFNKQFEFEPIVENEAKLVPKNRIIVAGMGGSGHAAMLVKDLYPEIDIVVHRNYGLPQFGAEKLQDSLIIVSSYSGNTEEAIDAFVMALEAGLPLAVVTTGGKLLSLAQQNKIPYIQMLDVGLQPRSALGYSALALLKIMGRTDALQEAKELSVALNPTDYEETGKQLAKSLYNKIPIVYASQQNTAISYVWKIKLNETGKTPAFCNVFPELNHNEIEGFDIKESAKDLSSVFVCVLLKDADDHPRIAKRMEIVAQLYKKRGIETYEIDLSGSNRLFKMFSSIVLADWVSFYIAKSYGIDPEQVPVIEEFKKLMDK